MTYKFYDEEGNELEIYKNYTKNNFFLDLNGQIIQLDDYDIEDLISVLNKLINNKSNILWNHSLNN